MLTLNDGRAELWQWDTGRTLAVDADCSQVHFSNKVFGRSIDVDVIGGTAIIPDVLLQTDKDLNVWAFVGTAENGYTKISKTFKVNRRNKPADYVFTQTDQITLQTIQSQIGELADLTTEAKDTLVAAINEAARTGGGAGSMDLRVADGYVQYSTDGGATWTNLIAVAELIGAPGKSAYDYAEEAGYTGTETEFAARLAADIPTVDSTLTKIGQAADAAVVGNRLSALSKEMLTEESDPTVPSWAKEAQKPSYTASEVGADPSGTAAAQVAAHNSGTDTHSDIRVLIQGLTDRLNALADSDDTTLDQLSEVVAYIKSNRTLIDAITTSKVSVEDIIDNLTTNVTNKPLSAAQGVALKALIDAISVPDKLPNPNALTFTGAVTGSYDGSAAVTVNIPSGGGRDSRLICDITLSEDAYSIEITSDLDGNSFELSEVWIFYEGSCTHTKNTYLSVSSVENPSKRWISTPEGTSQSGTSRKGCVHGVLVAPGTIRGDTVTINSNSGLYLNSAYNEPVSAYEDKITSLKLFTNSTLSYAFVAGFRVRVYGR